MSRLIESILACGGPRFEIIVVDQIEDQTTENSIAPYVARGGVNYTRSSTKGLAAARNTGICSAWSELIALTDDDCVVAENWIQRFVAAFPEDSRIGIVHGNVLAGSHDTNSGFIPTYRRDTPFLATTIMNKRRADRPGACMGLRKRTWNALRGFDEALGVSGQFRSAEDLDVGLRALLAGISIFEDPEL